MTNSSSSGAGRRGGLGRRLADLIEDSAPGRGPASPRATPAERAAAADRTLQQCLQLARERRPHRGTERGAAAAFRLTW